MRKKFICFIFSILSFLLFKESVLAKDVVVNVLPEQTKLFISSLDYSGVTCNNVSELKYFNVINNNGDYSVSVKSNVLFNEVYSEVLNCNYVKTNNENNLSNDKELNYVFNIKQNEYYEYKDLQVNESYLFKKDNINFDSCYSLDDNVSVKFSNGACLVKVKNKSSSVMEVIGIGGQVPYILKINVVDSASTDNVNYQSVNTQWESNELDYIKYNDYLMAGDEYDRNQEESDRNSDYESNYGSASANVSLSKSTACTSYYVDKLGSYKYFGQYKALEGGGYVGLLGMSTFKATEQCSENKDSYVAICLDPGMSTPEKIRYKLSRVINPTKSSVNQKFDKAAYYIASQIKNEGESLKNYDNTSIIATQLALRLISLTDNNAPTFYNSSNAKLFYYQYKYIADELAKAKNSKKTEFTLDTWSWCDLGIGPACSDFFRENGTADKDKEIKTKAENFLTAYLNNYPSFSFPTDTEFNFSMSDVEFETKDINSYNKEATFKGVINVPKGIDIKTEAKYKLYCNTNLQCQFALKSNGEYTLTVRYNKNYEGLLKKSNNLRVRLRFTNDKLNFSVSLLEPEDGSTSLQRLLIFNTDDTIIWLKFSSDMANKVCDMSNIINLPENMTTDEKNYFTSNDCCKSLSSSSPYYKALCACTTNNFKLVCDPNNDNYTDLYEVQEGRTNGIAKYSTCVVDVNWETNMQNSYDRNDAKLDASGNKVSLNAYKGNKYCRVSCFEDWQFVTSSFKNFTGDNAVLSGSYFQIDNDVFIGAKRTCVTTLVDYKMYYDDVKTLTNKIVVAYNSYVEFASAYDNMKKNWGHFGSGATCTDSTKPNPEIRKYIKSYTVESSSVAATKGGCCGCTNTLVESTDPDTGEVTSKEECVPNDCPAHTHYSYTEVKADCSIYNIHTHKGEALSSSLTDLDKDDTNGHSDDLKLNSASQTSSCTNATHGVTCSLKGSSSVNDGKCESDGWSDPFKTMVARVSYTSLNTAHLSTPGHTRTDGRTKTGALSLISGNVVAMHSYTRNLLKQYMKEMQELVTDMNACQNFYLTNTLKDNTKYNYGGTTAAKSYGTGFGYETTNPSKIANYVVSPNKIETIYDPDVRYQYEEAEYMTLIGDNNYLVNNTAKNKLYNTANNSCGLTGIKSGGQELKVCKNKVTTYSYGNKWENDTTSSRNYSDGTEKSTSTTNMSDDVLEKNKQIDVCQIVEQGEGLGWNNGTDATKSACLKAKLYYYKAYYRKQTLENSSFYLNKGNWFVNDKTDVKIHANSLNDSGDRESVKNIIKGKFIKSDWSPIARYNVFPIKITTRKNIYRYMYTFGNIGHYSDNTLGRIMGNETSIILDNRHVCFYEVIEKICKCCGDPIVTEYLDKGDSDKSDYGVITDNYLASYCKTHTCSNSEIGYDGNTPDYSSSGTLGFYSSSVSLYDLDGITSSKNNLSPNWSSNDTFYYEGTNYSTAKGGQLATYIEKVGEDIYNRNPEYSYYLTPSALNKIRKTGETGISQQGKDRIKGTDATGNGSSFSTNNFTDEENNTVVTFSHFTSVFLHQIMSDYITDQYRNVVIDTYPMWDSCIVTANDMKNDKPFKTMSTPCKWYDYVQCSGGQCFRLAYK